MCVFIQFNLHLISRKVNNQAAHFQGKFKNTKFKKKAFWNFKFFVPFLQCRELVQLDVACSMEPCRRLLPRRDRSISKSRATEAAAARDPTAPNTEQNAHGASTKNKAVANPFFYPSLPPKPFEHQPGHDFAQTFDRCIPVAAARVGLWGSPPKRSQERSPPSRCRRNKSAAGRGAPGRARAVARLVGCQRVLIDLMRHCHSNLEHNNERAIPR